MPTPRATREIWARTGSVLAQDEMPPDTHNTDLHFHSAREEAWFVRSGGGIARLGEDGYPLHAGSFWLCRETEEGVAAGSRSAPTECSS